MNIRKFINENDNLHEVNNNDNRMIVNGYNKGIGIPVICNHCGLAYDLTKVKIVRRYADCEEFTTPCCNYVADTRKWKSFNDFERLLVFNLMFI